MDFERIACNDKYLTETRKKRLDAPVIADLDELRGFAVLFQDDMTTYACFRDKLFA